MPKGGTILAAGQRPASLHANLALRAISRRGRQSDQAATIPAAKAAPAAKDWQRKGWTIRLGLSTRANLLIYALIAAMLLVYVPTVRSYMNLRQVFAEARRDLDRQMLVRRFERFAIRQAVEYFDVAFAGEDRSELQAIAQAASRSLKRLRETAGSATADVDALERGYSRLQEVGRQSQDLAAGSPLEARLELFGGSLATPRTDELQSLVDEMLSEESSIFENRLPAISGQLLLVPFAELESSATRLRADAAEAMAAAAFAQHLQRLILEYQDFAFLGGAWHKLYLARGKTEQAYEDWLGAIASSQAAQPAISEPQMRQLTGRYRELNRLGDRLVDVSETASKADALGFYTAELEPLADGDVSPALESVVAAYEAHLAVSIRSVSRRIDFAGWVLAAFALVAVVLALVSPRLMSRWIVQPIGALTQATRKLGSGDLSGQVVIQSTDELGELAGCFNQMVVDLKEAQDQLGRRERLVVLGQLAGSVAHEIRNPLGVMKNSIYFLRLTQKLKDEKAMQHLGLIEDEITRANRIITELLDYARDPTSQIGRLVLQEAFYRALAEVEVPETVRVEHEFDDEPLAVTGDSGQIERILANFLRNAVQAMPEGGRLSMRCGRQGDEMIAEVEDSGIGIAESEIPKIFEPLYTGKAKGIGLGLPLSRRYAMLNGGRIDCESELGQGATFRLTLPAAPAEEAAPETAPAAQLSNHLR